MNFLIRRPGRVRARTLATSFMVLFQAAVAVDSWARAGDVETPRVVDIASITCGDFERLSLPTALVLVGWIGGFYAGLRDDTKVDPSAFGDKADHVLALCRGNESMTLMALVEQELRPDREPADVPRPTPAR